MAGNAEVQYARNMCTRNRRCLWSSPCAETIGGLSWLWVREGRFGTPAPASAVMGPVVPTRRHRVFRRGVATVAPPSGLVRGAGESPAPFVPVADRDGATRQ